MAQRWSARIAQVRATIGPALVPADGSGSDDGPIRLLPAGGGGPLQDEINESADEHRMVASAGCASEGQPAFGCRRCCLGIKVEDHFDVV